MSQFAHYQPGGYAQEHIRITPTTLSDGREFFYLDDEDLKDKKEDVPMLRIQAAKLSDITSVVKKANPSVDISVNLSSEHINKLTSDYAKYINESNLNKNKVTSSEIIALVGTKTVFI